MRTAGLADAVQASITITDHTTQSSAHDGDGMHEFVTFSGTAIPTSTSITATDGDSVSTTTINWSTTGIQTVLSFDIQYERMGTRTLTSPFTDSSGNLYFIGDADCTYALSGEYQVTDNGATDSGYLFQYAYLDDPTDSASLFDGIQQSQSTHDEQFTLGLSEGDTFNDVTGSLTGNLKAGHDYHFFFHAFTSAALEDDSGASGEGSFTLTIAPEPASAALLAPGVLTICVRRCQGCRVPTQC
jgi:hypothetical protein